MKSPQGILILVLLIALGHVAAYLHGCNVTKAKLEAQWGESARRATAAIVADAQRETARRQRDTEAAQSSARALRVRLQEARADATREANPGCVRSPESVRLLNAAADDANAVDAPVRVHDAVSGAAAAGGR